jgi:hypothetical protein
MSTGSDKLVRLIVANVKMNMEALNSSLGGFNYFKFDSQVTIGAKRKKLQRILDELDDPEYTYRKYYASSYFAGPVDLNKFGIKLVSRKMLMSMTDAELVETCINNWVPYRVKRTTLVHFPITAPFKELLGRLRANPNYDVDVIVRDDYYDVEIVRRERKRVNVAEHEALTIFNRFYLAVLFKKTSITIASFLPWKEYLIALGYDVTDHDILTVNL